MKQSPALITANHFYTFLCPAVLLLLHVSLCAQAANKTDEYPGKIKILFSEISWDGALKKAAATHKRIFVDAYASWCGPCKQLKAFTFKNQEAAMFFNQDFINLSIDMEKGEGVNLATKWNIQAILHSLFSMPPENPFLKPLDF